jgi:hypothetical protein
VSTLFRGRRNRQVAFSQAGPLITLFDQHDRDIVHDGIFPPQSLQMNHASLCSLSSPPVVRTQLGQRRISINVSLTIHAPFLVHSVKILPLKLLAKQIDILRYEDGFRQRFFSFASFSGSFESGPYWQIACQGW